MTIITFLYFIVGLGLLIFIHELGHFLVAKRAGIRVEKFSLGFGPKLIAFTRGETEYRLSLLPLGGYVKMSGEDPSEEKEETVNDPRSFSAQPLRKRIAVVAAGPVMNLILALVLMPLVFMIGRMEPNFIQQPPIVIGVKKDSPAQKIELQIGDQITSINGVETPTWDMALQRILISPEEEVTLEILRKDSKVKESKKVRLSTAKEGKVGFLGVEPHLFIGNEPVIDRVIPDSPAEKAGIQAKDQVVSINGEPIQTWDGITEKVAELQGKPALFGVIRNGSKVSLSLTPRFDEPLKKWLIGITKESSKKNFAIHKYGFVGGIKKGLEEYKRLFGLTLEVLKKLFSLQLSYKTLGGPIQIAQATANAAESGFGDFIYFLSFLSIQLGVLNLLPIPVLDGGHLFFMGYEAIRRKPLSIRKRMIAQQIGMALLFTLMILVTFNDINSIWGIEKLFHKVVGWF